MLLIENYQNVIIFIKMGNCVAVFPQIFVELLNCAIYILFWIIEKRI
jgi:hypothetical protein